MAYVERERTMSPPIVSPVANAARTTARSSLSPLRQRGLHRASTFSDSSLRRTSSLTSNFSDSAAQSFKSTTDDIFLPKARSPDVMTGHEPSHWHSVPLALALLPALGGLFFEKGSTVITDITLLTLAAVFLNWSVRLPWDWYHSAQAINVQDDYPLDAGYTSDAIIEEDSETGSQHSRAPSPSPSQQDSPNSSPRKPSRSHTSAATELRIHELLALTFCFISPLIGAWLLHHIRAQLSRPSEGLVSNYNLTIFLLASELRPLSHLIKLVQARTLHLQRTVSTNPHLPSSSSSFPPLSPTTLKDLTSRLSDLETHVADSAAATSPSSPQSIAAQVPELTATIRHSLQPDLDALNRAVRRYEKRAVLLSMQTEKRLQDLESRMSDAITLAAAAERSSQNHKQRRGSGVMLVVDGFAKVVLLPLQVGLSVLSLPGQVVGGLVGWVEEAVGRRVKREMRTAGRGEGRGSASASASANASASERERERERERGGRRAQGQGVAGGGGGVGNGSGRGGKKVM